MRFVNIFEVDADDKEVDGLIKAIVEKVNLGGFDLRKGEFALEKEGLGELFRQDNIYNINFLKQLEDSSKVSKQELMLEIYWALN